MRLAKMCKLCAWYLLLLMKKDMNLWFASQTGFPPTLTYFQDCCGKKTLTSIKVQREMGKIHSLWTLSTRLSQGSCYCTSSLLISALHGLNYSGVADGGHWKSADTGLLKHFLLIHLQHRRCSALKCSEWKNPTVILPYFVFIFIKVTPY